MLGASPATVFRRVVLPQTRAAFLVAAVLTFAHTVGEFGVVLMIGGDIPGVTRTLSIAIYDQVQDLQYDPANRTALALLAISFAALLVVYSRGSGRHHRDRERSRDWLNPPRILAPPHPASPHHRLSLRGSLGHLQLDVDLSLTAPWTVIYGPSGSGKSTVLRACCGLLPGLTVLFERHSPPATGPRFPPSIR